MTPSSPGQPGKPKPGKPGKPSTPSTPPTTPPPRPAPTPPADKATGWCPGGHSSEPLTPGEEISGRAVCRTCGRNVKVRRDTKGTPLGVEKHKAAPPDPIQTK